ncbi:MAG: dTDP-4-dehydrorhamnose reductase [Pseudomonadota bacterium]
MTPRVLLTGAHGQLGWELQRSRPAHIELHAHDADTLDITDAEAVRAMIEAVKPTWIINAAAYTAVDKAESDTPAAHAVNAEGPRLLAEAARAAGARMAQISTDFVFNGGQGRPYLPDDATAPLGVYGATKLNGERAVRETLGAHALVLRTAWVYSTHGHNFVKTMLRLMRERDQLGVVADQIGSPTWAHGLAQTLWQAVRTGLGGVHHWTDAGVASWYDFACAIHDEARALGLLERDTAIRPIRTQDYPTPAARPSYSVLDKTSTWQALSIDAPAHWRTQLRAMLHDFKESAYTPTPGGTSAVHDGAGSRNERKAGVSQPAGGQAGQPSVKEPG